MAEQEKTATDSVVYFGSYQLEWRSAQLWRGAQAVKLTGKAFAVLRYFVEHPGQLVTKDDLFQAVWPETVVTESTLTSCIQELRQALRDNAKKPRYIETVHRRGYRFIAEVASRQEEVASSQESVGRSQEEVASRQYSVDSREENQTINGINGPASNGQGLETNGGGPASHVQGREAKNDSALSPPLQTPDTSVASSSRFTRAFMLAAVVLVAVTIMTVQYLSRPTLSTQDSELSPASPPVLLLPDKPSIVVLPFVNLSGDPEQDYFSDGLTDDLTTDLSQLTGLFVIARNSAFAYKGKAVKVQEISKELGVRYVLEGSVRKTGDQVRINAQLVDATTGHHMWAGRYDRPLRDIFTLQDEIRQQIVAMLQVEVTEAELARVGRAPTENLTAYDYYLRGIVYFQRFTKEMNAQARQMFEKAIELDPKFAHAYAIVAWTHFQDWLFQWSQDPQVLEQAFVAAQKSVALNDSLPLAHATLGHMYLWKKQHDQAIAAHEKAVALGPSCALCYSELGNTLLYAGRPEEALGALEKEIRLDPQEAISRAYRFGMAYRLLGRYDEALAACKKTLAHYPNHLGVHFVLALIYSDTGREAEARAEVEEIRRISPRMSLEGVKQRQAYKDPVESEREIAALRKAGLK